MQKWNITASARSLLLFLEKKMCLYQGSTLAQDTWKHEGYGFPLKTIDFLFKTNCTAFSLFYHYHTLKTDVVISLTNLNHHQDKCFVPSFIQNAPLFSKKMRKIMLAIKANDNRLCENANRLWLRWTKKRICNIFACFETTSISHTFNKVYYEIRYCSS